MQWEWLLFEFAALGFGVFELVSLHLDKRRRTTAESKKTQAER